MSTTALNSTGIERCAVAKIDTKGRFVLANDALERLLGQKQDDLFGQPLTAWLDENEHPFVERLLRPRHHYENAYESTVVSLRVGDGVVPVRLFASLSYIAGQPGSFTVLVHPLAADDAERAVDQKATGPASLEKYIADGRWIGQIPDLVDGIRQLIGAQAVLIYDVTADELRPLDGWSRFDDEHPFEGVDETNELHRSVAFAGWTYDPTDQDAVARAVEVTGSAPNEWLLRVEAESGQEYLIRAIWSSADATKESASTRRTIAELLQAAPTATFAASDLAVDPLTWLDQAQVPAALLSASGLVSAVNSGFSSDQVEQGSEVLLTSLGCDQATLMAERIRLSFRSSSRPLVGCWPIQTASGNQLLSLVYLEAERFLLTVWPQPTGVGQPDSAELARMMVKMLRLSTDRLRAAVDLAVGGQDLSATSRWAAQTESVADLQARAADVSLSEPAAEVDVMPQLDSLTAAAAGRWRIDGPRELVTSLLLRPFRFCVAEMLASISRGKRPDDSELVLTVHPKASSLAIETTRAVTKSAFDDGDSLLDQITVDLAAVWGASLKIDRTGSSVRARLVWPCGLGSSDH